MKERTRELAITSYKPTSSENPDDQNKSGFVFLTDKLFGGLGFSLNLLGAVPMAVGWAALTGGSLLPTFGLGMAFVFGAKYIVNQSRRNDYEQARRGGSSSELIEFSHLYADEPVE